MSESSPIHLNPVAEFHPHVLLPGDPARAMLIAQTQLEDPRMFNHRRGLWGYSGRTPEGVGLLIQSTGMGGPSAAIVCEELVDLGAQTLLRVGTCGALSGEVALGDLVVATEVIGMDGASARLSGAAVANGEAMAAGDENERDRLPADSELVDAIVSIAESSGLRVHAGPVATVDLFYDPNGERLHEELTEAGVLAIEMEAAAVHAVAARRGVRAAAVFVASDTLWGDAGRDRITQDVLETAGERLGAVAVAAMLRVV